MAPAATVGNEKGKPLALWLFWVQVSSQLKQQTVAAFLPGLLFFLWDGGSMLIFMAFPSGFLVFLLFLYIPPSPSKTYKKALESPM